MLDITKKWLCKKFGHSKKIQRKMCDDVCTRCWQVVGHRGQIKLPVTRVGDRFVVDQPYGTIRDHEDPEPPSN